MEMLKKIICLALALNMLSSVCAFAATDVADSGAFDAELITAIDPSADAWFSTSSNRATFTVAVVLGFMMNQQDEATYPLEDCFAQSSYIAKSDNTLLVHLHGPDNDVVFFYYEDEGIVTYSVINPYSDTVIESSLEAWATDGYYRNDDDQIALCIDILAGEILDEEA